MSDRHFSCRSAVGRGLFLMRKLDGEVDIATKQYYIVGEQQYCLIHLTSYSGSESAESAVQSMADSFIWD